jgi:YbbR domain-containing protein
MNQAWGKILKNLNIRIASLVLAATLWLYASTEKEYQLEFHCPVTVWNLPEGMTLSNCPPAVSCDIRARGKDLIALRLKPPAVMINAENRQVRSFRIRLGPDNLKLPYNIRVQEANFQAPELEIRLDRLSQRELPVRPDFTGDPAEGLVLSDSLTVNPPLVTLSGPSRLIEQVEQVYTKAIRLDGLSGPAEVTARLAVPDSCLIRVSPESVAVKLSFERSDERVLKNVPLAVTNRPDNYLVSFSPGTIDLVISGPRQAVQALEQSQVKITLDLKGLAPGKHQLQAAIMLPEKLLLVAASPRDFEVTIR